MNERIQQLAEQASIFANTSYIPESTWQIVRDQKFAELIVKECAEYIDAFNRKNMVEEGIGGTELKQHFGVEE